MIDIPARSGASRVSTTLTRNQKRRRRRKGREGRNEERSNWEGLTEAERNRDGKAKKVIERGREAEMDGGEVVVMMMVVMVVVEENKGDERKKGHKT